MITDIRITKVNGVIQFQVKERILLPYAVLDKRDHSLTADGWLSAPLFYVTDLNVMKDVDFHELSYDNRTMVLVDVQLPKGQLLTGVRFCVKNGRLTIEVRGTAFDYVTGNLIDQGESTWISKDVLNTDSFVKFGPTAYSQDVGQTTVPYIESSAIEPTYLVPLAGAGLYYKGTKGSISFIAPKLISYDIEPNILP